MYSCVKARPESLLWAPIAKGMGTVLPQWPPEKPPPSPRLCLIPHLRLRHGSLRRMGTPCLIFFMGNLLVMRLSFLWGQFSRGIWATLHNICFLIPRMSLRLRSAPWYSTTYVRPCNSALSDPSLRNTFWITYLETLWLLFLATLRVSSLGYSFWQFRAVMFLRPGPKHSQCLATWWGNGKNMEKSCRV